MDNLEFMKSYFRLKKQLNYLSDFITNNKIISRRNKEIFNTLSSISVDARICGKTFSDKLYTMENGDSYEISANHRHLRDYFFSIAAICRLCEDTIQSISNNSKAKTIPLKKVKQFYKTMFKVMDNIEFEYIDYEINLIKDGMGD